LVASDYTRPTTRYVTNRALPEQAEPADANALQPEHTHLPLVIMLVLTQVAVGLFLASLVHPSSALPWAANLTLQAGLAASVLHLGQPLRAWRAFLGWRQSWLSREIIAFSLLAAAGALTLLGISAVGAVVTGALAVVCSIKVYEDTRRPDWSAFITTWRFGGTLALAASFTLAALDPSWRMTAFTVLSAKLAGETLWLFADSSDRRWRIHALPLRAWTLARLTLAVSALALLPFAPLLAWLPALAGEFAERVLFFKAVRPWKMPGS
jgi:DMSO reductase anchor subunit